MEWIYPLTFINGLLLILIVEFICWVVGWVVIEALKENHNNFKQDLFVGNAVVFVLTLIAFLIFQAR